MKTIYITKIFDSYTSYMGESYNEAMEVYHKSKSTCSVLRMDPDSPKQVLLHRKIQDSFSRIMQDAFYAAVRV
jgi:hypothetical protein